MQPQLMPQPDRRQLLARHITQIELWVDTHCTDPELHKLIPLYSAHRGSRSISELDKGGQMSRCMCEAYQAHDNIGWRDLIKGKIATAIKNIQEVHILSSLTRHGIAS